MTSILPIDDPDAVRAQSLRAALTAGSGRSEVLSFHVGGELFALDLASVEEVVELPEIHPLPHAPDAMLGALRLRRRLIPAYTPASLLGVTNSRPRAVLVLRHEERRVAVAIDDVDDVLVVNAHDVRRPPTAEGVDSMLVGVTVYRDRLVSLLDAELFVHACAGESAREIA
ncbi:MAG TPA: chemotaxis protein CheW [Gemmatimonadaceae bacterium]|nr:chemotaxis protein CheW [Gemmatimonadaceae bacterium]